MRRGLGSGGSRWLGWSKEDEDLMACQVISTFFWILLVLLVNFFVLHRSNTIPSAEARWVEPRTALRPPLVPPLQVVRAMHNPPVPWEKSPELERDDYKPNYYFLYRDQVRIVDFMPKKVLVAKRKIAPQPRTKPEKEEVRPEKEPQKVTRPVRPEWVEMTMLEERRSEEEKPEPVEPAPQTVAPRPIQVAMVKELDLDMEIARDVPVPVVPERREERVPVPARKLRISAMDVDMNMSIEDRPEPKKPPRIVSEPRREERSPVVASPAAQYVSLPMEIDAGGEPAPAAARVSAQQPRKGALGHRFVATGPALPAASIPMSLEIEEAGGREVSRFGGQGTIRDGGKTARLLALTRRRLGGIDLPVAIGGLEQGKAGLAKLAEEPKGPAGPGKVIPVTARTEKGSIPLGEPLAFALADVGEETHSGSAYIRKSAKLRRLLEGQGLPDTPVTVSVSARMGEGEQGEVLAAVSYSRNQVVLQYANGKQQIVRLVEGEPYPHFELRSAAGSARRIPVGTKLQEITSCLSTLEHILKE